MSEPREMDLVFEVEHTKPMEGHLQTLDVVLFETVRMIEKSAYEKLLARNARLIEALEYYAAPFENDGCWIGGPLYVDRCNGNDMEKIEARAFGGKRARAALRDEKESEGEMNE